MNKELKLKEDNMRRKYPVNDISVYLKFDSSHAYTSNQGQQNLSLSHVTHFYVRKPLGLCTLVREKMLKDFFRRHPRHYKIIPFPGF